MVRAHAFRGHRPAPDVTGPLDDVLARGGGGRGLPVRPHGMEHLLGFVPEGGPLPLRLRNAETALRTGLATGAWCGDAVAGVDVLTLGPVDADGPPTTSGFVLTLDLHDPQLLPHEAVVADAASERAQVREALGADLAPLLTVRDRPSPAGRRPRDLAVGAPTTEATDTGGTLHRLWHLDDPVVVAAVIDDLAAVDVLVADGHHRLAAARAHAGRTPDPAAGRLLVYVTEPDRAPALSPRSLVTDLARVWSAARGETVLPKKSTRFEPKPRAGMVVRLLAHDRP